MYVTNVVSKPAKDHRIRKTLDREHRQTPPEHRACFPENRVNSNMVADLVGIGARANMQLCNVTYPFIDSHFLCKYGFGIAFNSDENTRF